MSEHIHHYTSDDLSLTQAHSYTLLLQVDENRFSYAVIDGKQLLDWAENHPVDELRDPKQLRDILTANYKQVVTGLHGTGFTLLPSSLFDTERVADAARLLDVSDDEEVSAEVLDNQNIIVYKINEALTRATKDLDNQKTVYSNAGWIKAIADARPADADIYLDMGNGMVSILNFKDTRLRFYNTFKFNNHEELAYFCALVCSELAIKPEDARLIISGDINDTDGYFTYLQGFFGEVTLNALQVLNLPQNIPSHKILALAALSLCALSEEN
ncbi:DUF3822 family protein [Mucilaginibacter sp. AK015]|uniref:DUF3822 family protein n=1 Tax=Mucilaginibacter sp. AK015 TaxID=2723072 RepID=UPI00161DAE47|nr:DUF3822 family protein [Mucilaginibacter sp. AK015]MBB5394622.1 hypothetical protein [Mucilaginibacter sp. AK015]